MDNKQEGESKVCINEGQSQLIIIIIIIIIIELRYFMPRGSHAGQEIIKTVVIWRK